ncbi:MAG: nucleotidyltransferase family protein [Nanoarchaeota archaeon]|nr:nucleotidyltransferase family protein [Nanoarchaeota archaeon]
MIKKAIILAGGKGERLRPLTYKIPKPLLPFREKEMMIEHIFDSLKKHDIKDVIFTLCYMPEAFKEKLGNGKKYGLNFQYLLEQEPLGTAGFLNLSPIQETTLVINSDVFFTNLDITDFYNKHKEFVEKGAIATLALSNIENTENLGTVKLDGNRIVNFAEKKNTSNYVNAGHYLLEPPIMNYLPPQKKIMFETDIFPNLAVKGKLFAYFPKSEWIHIRDLESYKKLNQK